MLSIPPMVRGGIKSNGLEVEKKKKLKIKKKEFFKVKHFWKYQKVKFNYYNTI